MAGSGSTWPSRSRLSQVPLLVLVALVLLHSASSEPSRDFVPPGRQKREVPADLLSQMGRSVRGTLDAWIGPETMHVVSETTSQVLGAVSSCISVGFFALSGIAAQLLNALGLDGSKLFPSPLPPPRAPQGQLNSRPETAATCQSASCRRSIPLSHSLAWNSPQPGITPILRPLTQVLQLSPGQVQTLLLWGAAALVGYWLLSLLLGLVLALLGRILWGLKLVFFLVGFVALVRSVPDPSTRALLLLGLLTLYALLSRLTGSRASGVQLEAKVRALERQVEEMRWRQRRAAKGTRGLEEE
ncbi:hypothetical protein QTO34_003192 [Cnephaeus nilssonii]|uniref:Transmembrane protein 109 n=1 Tax=Cnephaeus nilssonii TaxID=3371016 RepID=A0AA40HR36_CNENI|nr:hypothetical protein QTO34_003192 [Eptesicus nilssonii]